MSAPVDLDYYRRLRAYPRHVYRPPAPQVDPRDARIALLEADVRALNERLMETNRALLKMAYAQALAVQEKAR